MIEKSGIPTVSISLLEEVTGKVKPPRALLVDAPLGYPLGKADDPMLQKRIIERALSLLSLKADQPITRPFSPV
ncbi:MAG: hypothetical protein ACE5JX_06870 [Acidobacteriota bacterium]